MVELKIDFIPFGNEPERRTIEKVQIINNGENDECPEFGDYTIKCNGSAFKIENHKRSNSHWYLIKKIAEIIIGE